MGSITTVADLQNALQSAVALEFATIPPYLCGQWSIKDPANQCAQLIQDVAVAEMRHLTIVANCLIAVGGSPNMVAAAPSYPAYLPDGETEFEVSLLPFGPDFLKQGMNIEKPSTMVVSEKIQRLAAQGLAIPRRHRLLAMGNMFATIGQFYTAIIQGIQTLVAQSGEAAVFPNSGSTNKQVGEFKGEDVTISGIARAITLLTDVIDEGEGASGAMWDENGHLAHFYVFQQITLGKLYQQGDTPGNPTGSGIDVPAAAGIFPMLPNPTMADYLPATSQLWKDADAFNVDFETVVNDLQSAFNGTPSKIGKAIGDMFSLPGDAQTVFGNAAPNQPGLVAGPTFQLPSSYRTT